jgi:hypothetical protein
MTSLKWSLAEPRQMQHAGTSLTDGDRSSMLRATIFEALTQEQNTETEAYAFKPPAFSGAFYRFNHPDKTNNQPSIPGTIDRSNC